MKLKIFKPKDSDSIIQECKNPEFSTLLIGCDTREVNNNFLSLVKRRGFFIGKTSDIEDMIKEYDLKEGSEFPLDCKIIIQEQTTPFYEGQQPKVNPVTGEVITSNGEVVYRQSTVVDAKDNRDDIKLPSDSTSVNNSIKEASLAAEKSFTE